MHRRFTVLIIASIAGLSLLLLKPSFPKLKKEAVVVYQLWQALRSSDLTVTDLEALIEAVKMGPITAETDKDEAIQRRELLEPALKDQAAQQNSQITLDPFILEARRRAEADPVSALQWLQTQSSGSERLRGMLEVVALWAAEDSEATLLWLESNAQGLARLATLSSGVELWAERNPTETAAWVEGMANDGSKITAAQSLAVTWLQSQPEQAAAWVTALPQGPIRDDVSTALASAWIKTDPQAAAVWALTEAEFYGNNQLLESTVEAFTLENSADAELFLREIAQPSTETLNSFDISSLLSKHVQARAKQDPLATAQWLASISPSDPLYSTQSPRSLMQIWAETDSIAASQWLSEQDAGDQLDTAIIGFSESIERYEPEAATVWANTIGEPEQRIQRLRASLNNWAKTAPRDAEQWLIANEFESTLRDDLTKIIIESTNNNNTQ